jgi:hypothetical protein
LPAVFSSLLVVFSCVLFIFLISCCIDKKEACLLHALANSPLHKHAQKHTDTQIWSHFCWTETTHTWLFSSQAEARAEFAERSVQKLQKEVDRLEGIIIFRFSLPLQFSFFFFFSFLSFFIYFLIHQFFF